MSWPAILLNMAIALGLGTYLVRRARLERVQVPAQLSPRDQRVKRIGSAGLVVVTGGILCVFAWMITDGFGPRWLHRLSLTLAIALIAGGFTLSAVAGWMKGGAT